MTIDDKRKAIDVFRRHQRKRGLSSLRLFCEDAWHVVEPGIEFVPGWHIDAICDHLQAMFRGDIRNLLINIPPRHAKSTILSVMFPAWAWLQQPNHKLIFASHSHPLSKRDSIKCRLLLESEWYRTTFAPEWGLADDQNEKMNFHNTKMGSRLATSVGSKIVGFGGDTLAIDDPHSPRDVLSPTVRQGVLDWFDQEFASRVNDPKTANKVVIMQRLHQNDLCGHLLDRGGWDHLCLPARYESAMKKTTSIGWSDPRAEEGEPLWPARFGEKEISGFEKTMGPQVAAGQMQQRPAPASGNIFKREWWKFYKVLPGDIRKIIQSWDLTFTEGPVTDFVVGQVWGLHGTADKYLIDQFRARVGFNGQITAFQGLTGKHPKATGKYVEKAANAHALHEVLKKKIPGINLVPVEGSKVARAESVSPEVQAGNIYLPDPSIAPWVMDFIEEHAVFPFGTHDDQVDAMSQAITVLNSRNMVDFSTVSITGESKWR